MFTGKHLVLVRSAVNAFFSTQKITQKHANDVTGEDMAEWETLWSFDGDGSNTDTYFRTRSNGVMVPFLVGRSDGQVGINTTNTKAMLTVPGSINSRILVLDTNQITQAGTDVTVNLQTRSMQYVTLTNDANFVIGSVSPGVFGFMDVTPGGAPRNLSFDANFKWMTQTPTVLPTGEIMQLHFVTISADTTQVRIWAYLPSMVPSWDVVDVGQLNATNFMFATEYAPGTSAITNYPNAVTKSGTNLFIWSANGLTNYYVPMTAW